MKTLEQLIQEKAQKQRAKIARAKKKREKIISDFINGAEA